VAIRPIAPADVDACAAIMVALPLWAQYGITPAAARAVFDEALSGPARVQVAEDGGRVVGFVEYFLRGTFGHSGYIRAIGVAPDAQGRGIGARLMDAAEAEIFRTGPNVFLLVTGTNTRAQRFYERRGYCRIGEIPSYARAGLTEVLYRKSLGPIAGRSLGEVEHAGGARTVRRAGARRGAAGGGASDGRGRGQDDAHAGR